MDACHGSAPRLILFFMLGLHAPSAFAGDPGVWEGSRSQLRRLDSLGSVVELAIRDHVEPVDPDDLFVKMLEGFRDKYAPRLSLQSPGQGRILVACEDTVAEAEIRIEDSDAFIKVARTIVDPLGECAKPRKLCAKCDLADALVDSIAVALGGNASYLSARGLKEFTEDQRSEPAPNEWKRLSSGVDLFRLRRFTPETPTAMKRALQRSARTRESWLIIDLRGNPGGLLTAVVRCAGYLLPPKTVIAETKGRIRDSLQLFMSDDRPVVSPKGLVILVDGGTQAGAEMFAAALRGSRGAVLIGQPTAGFGRVHSVYRLEDGSGVSFSTSLLFTPDGSRLEGNGLEVDFPIESAGADNSDPESDPLIRKALDLFRERGMEAPADAMED